MPKSAPTHRQNIKSKHDLSEFCLTENWSERQSPHKAVPKKCASVLEQRFLKGRQKCAQTGEYLSRNKHDQIMPDSITYSMSNSVQHFLTLLEKDRAPGKASQTQGRMEKSLLERLIHERKQKF